jgi:N-formylglutamate amidohydrolase
MRLKISFFAQFSTELTKVDGVYICQKPARPAAPLVLDSPHSGRVYPEDFNHACPKSWLEETEDSYVDELFGDAPERGVPLLSALFPRCYIDPNRAVDDIDPLLLDGAWPHSANPTARSSLGVGLIRRLHKQNSQREIYDRKLAVAEVEHRIDAYYTPYHAALKTLLDEAYAAFGAVFHLNCHSMPATATRASRPADIVLGDRDGTTCDAAFTRFAARSLKDMGYKVAVNHPYKGVELVRRYADPARNRHSLQIELRRTLYMDEQSREKHAGFARLKHDMARFTGQLADFARESAVDLAAD